jgi:hypothetical protein
MTILFALWIAFGCLSFSANAEGDETIIQQDTGVGV